jgi:hypothetical protein
MGSSECQGDGFWAARNLRRVEARISDYNPQAAFYMRPLAFEISQRESVSTLRCNVSLIEGIATDSFVANSGGEN